MTEPRQPNPRQPVNNEAVVEPYKLSEIFFIIPEFEGDQISLGTFINSCDVANTMATGDQKILLVIHIKNKLKGRAAQLINSRNPSTYQEIKQLLNLHFGDSRDLSSLIQDLQRLRQLSNESPLTFYNRLQVLNAKMHSCVQKTANLTAAQKAAQCTLIDTMSLNTLLTGLEPRLGQIIRANNPDNLLDAHNRIRRELQLSYFETQKTIRPPVQKPPQPIRRPPIQNPQFPKCYSCGRLGHISSECRAQQAQRPSFSGNTDQRNYQNNPGPSQQQRPNPPFQNNSHQNNFRPSPSAQQNQNRPSVIQRNPNNYSSYPRTHHINYDQQYQPYYDSYNQDPYYENAQYTPDQYESDHYFENCSVEPIEAQDHQNFPLSPHHTQPPDSLPQIDPMTEIQNQIQTLNLDNMDPNANFPEQMFL